MQEFFCGIHRANWAIHDFWYFFSLLTRKFAKLPCRSTKTNSYWIIPAALGQVHIRAIPLNPKSFQLRTLYLQTGSNHLVTSANHNTVEIFWSKILTIFAIESESAKFSKMLWFIWATSFPTKKQCENKCQSIKPWFSSIYPQSSSAALSVAFQ